MYSCKATLFQFIVNNTIKNVAYNNVILLHCNINIVSEYTNSSAVLTHIIELSYVLHKIKKIPTFVIHS